MERLFDHLEIDPIGLERIRAVESPGVTHIGFRIVKEMICSNSQIPFRDL